MGTLHNIETASNSSSTFTELYVLLYFFTNIVPEELAYVMDIFVKVARTRKAILYRDSKDPTLQKEEFRFELEESGRNRTVSVQHSSG